MKTLCLSLLMSLAATAGAQVLDPTRPPAYLLGGASAAAPVTVAAAPQLQSILIAPKAGGRHVVVIDGQTLRLGERYKGALLAAVSPTQVVLQHGGQRRVLKLHADPVPR